MESHSGGQIFALETEMMSTMTTSTPMERTIANEANIGRVNTDKVGSKNGESKKSSITVAVRVRPFTTEEESKLIVNEEDALFLGGGSFSVNTTSNTHYKKSIMMPKGIRKIIDVVDDKMLIFDPLETNPLTKMQRNAFPNTKPTARIREHRFVFDKLFDVQASQEDVYRDTTRPLLDCVLEGFNATVFAYGATGCGKTHTILGTPASPGVIFLTMKELYERIEELRDTKSIDVSLSFLEIYNETIRDLLKPETEFKKLVLREDSKNHISVSNLLSRSPQSVEEVMELILQGNQNRTCSPTEANATSSRSHAVLQINVTQKNRTADVTETTTFATLSIIDLAGSERAAATKNRGARLNEGANINKSLLALGNCINALCDPRRRNHIPYRDSKLTRLLKFSLGGNCKTVMIVCISALSQHYDETLNTLKYADRAKEIKTKLIKNQHNLDRHVGSYLKMITEQRQEIAELRERELRVIELTLNKQKIVESKNLNLILDNIESIKASLAKQNQDKWRKFFMLAKRKLLLMQKIESETLLSGLYKGLQDKRNILGAEDMMNLLEQIVSKANSQIKDLEEQYSSPSEIDFILNESSQQTLKKLKEYDGWSEFHTLVFEKLVSTLVQSLEREVLFNSSVLFDYLVSELNEFSYLAKHSADLLSDFLMKDKENIDEKYNVKPLINKLTKSLELIVNGEYDAAIEKHTTSFMQRKLEQELRGVNHSHNGIPSNSNGNSASALQKARDSKRGPLSPLRSSPPRNFKKTITKKPIAPKLSPFKLKQSKKVRWDVPNNDSTIGESDYSMDDNTSNNNTLLKSDQEDDSPFTNSILTKAVFQDDLDLKFDPSLNSPPVKDASRNLGKSNSDSIQTGRIKHRQPFMNRRLSVNLGDQNHESLSKLPLLNKQASTKIINEDSTSSPSTLDDNSAPPYMPSPSPSKMRFNTLGAPSRVISKFSVLNNNDRDIESNGSDKVE
ncbi:uncharacterized protein PRCAT00005227001 [Priceomyces carsonii]|uniref:uncharacterized protein n=1 Tax=Priceomyces carsonii TaxID=28549 RepID=UPI002ED90568|nr:unnamed protein product [Priceomyces carsonii]